LASHEHIVIGVRPNPEPNNTVVRFDCQRTVVKPYTNRPIRTDLLEVE